MYTHQVNYSKHFTSGIFAGRIYHAHLRFTDLESAQQFKTLCESGKVFEPCAGNSAYTVDDCTLITLE